MKLAFVHDDIYPYAIGGIEKRNWEAANRFILRGHEVTIFGMKRWEGNDIIVTPEGVRLWGVCPAKRQFIEGRRSVWQAVYFACRLLTPLAKERFDIINVDSSSYLPCYSAKLISLLKGTPLIITWHEFWDDYWFEYLGKFRGFIGKQIERLAIRLPKLIIPVSEKVKGDLLSVKVAERKARVIPTGIDIHRIHEVRPAVRGFDVIFVGGLIRHKNVDLLIKAIDMVRNRLPEVKCGIIGNGPERPSLLDLVESLKLKENIAFLWFLDNHDDVIAYMKASKVFAFPSVREGLGLAVLEANACGCPSVIVKHKNNAAVYLVEDGGNGFIAEPSAESISERILLLLGDERVRSKLQKKAAVFAEKYDWDSISLELEKTFGEAINK